VPSILPRVGIAWAYSPELSLGRAFRRLCTQTLSNKRATSVLGEIFLSRFGSATINLTESGATLIPARGLEGPTQGSIRITRRAGMEQVPHHRKKIMQGLGALAAGALVVLLSADAGAFECANVRLPSSLVVCSDPDLMRIADERQQVYGKAWARLDADQREALKADQNRWVREYATACGVPPDLPPHLPPTPAVKECFEQAGFARIAVLRGYPDTATGSHSPAVPGPGTPRVPERIPPGTGFSPGQTIVPDREARGGSAAILAGVIILAAILGIVWLIRRAKRTERRRTVERVADQAGAFPAVPVRINLQSGEIGLFEAPASRSPFPDVTIDRAAIRSMVEDHWRSFISVAVSNPQIGFQTLQNFDERIQATAALMPPERAAMYLQAVEEEREILFNEYNRNPDALKRRLGLGPVRQPNRVVHQHQRQSIGEMAVRTAVRATIWESVISLFRGFR
jgi:hypothetical protein